MPFLHVYQPPHYHGDRYKMEPIIKSAVYCTEGYIKIIISVVAVSYKIPLKQQYLKSKYIIVILLYNIFKEQQYCLLLHYTHIYVYMYCLVSRNYLFNYVYLFLIIYLIVEQHFF